MELPAVMGCTTLLWGFLSLHLRWNPHAPHSCIQSGQANVSWHIQSRAPVTTIKSIFIPPHRNLL